MGCSSCAVSKDGTPTGCGNKGHCNSGTCNKMNTYDWLTTMELEDPSNYPIVEVSFKKGTRKAFFLNHPQTRAITGDMVVVEAANGYDVGRITLSGDLVRLQMKKKKVSEERVIHNVVRRANDRDLYKLRDARAKEKPSLIKSRQLARTLDLDMKIGEVEYQGDLRKATFYYIADGRVDFRELVRVYAREFRVKIEMRQIGSRQESGLVGGVGACGRELCCSTWLSDFSSVTTTAARYQNIAINQTKLSGQCGRLKCCLNYELDMYIEALAEYPRHIDSIKMKNGKAFLTKVDIFSELMFYSVPTELGRSTIVGLRKEQVIEYKEMNNKKIFPEKLIGAATLDIGSAEKETVFEDVTGQIELPEEKKPKRSRGKKRYDKRRGGSSRSSKYKDSSSRSKSSKPSGTGNKSSDGKPDSTASSKGGSSSKSSSRSKNYRSNKKSDYNKNNDNSTKKD